MRLMKVAKNIIESGGFQVNWDRLNKETMKSSKTQTAMKDIGVELLVALLS
jgi:hypothetical protein